MPRVAQRCWFWSSYILACFWDSTKWFRWVCKIAFREKPSCRSQFVLNGYTCKPGEDLKYVWKIRSELGGKAFWEECPTQTHLPKERWRISPKPCIIWLDVSFLYRVWFLTSFPSHLCFSPAWGKCCKLMVVAGHPTVGEGFPSFGTRVTLMWRECSQVIGPLRLFQVALAVNGPINRGF